jgi:hypothetical protein
MRNSTVLREKNVYRLCHQIELLPLTCSTNPFILLEAQFPNCEMRRVIFTLTRYMKARNKMLKTMGI